MSFDPRTQHKPQTKGLTHPSTTPQQITIYPRLFWWFRLARRDAEMVSCARSVSEDVPRHPPTKTKTPASLCPYIWEAIFCLLTRPTHHHLGYSLRRYPWSKIQTSLSYSWIVPLCISQNDGQQLPQHSKGSIISICRSPRRKAQHTLHAPGRPGATRNNTEGARNLLFLG